MRSPLTRAFALLLALTFSGACSTSGTTLKAPTGSAVGADSVDTVNTGQHIQPLVTGLEGFTLRSVTFEAGEPISESHTYSGGNSSPPLLWENVPANTTELALVMRNADRGDVIHWVVTGISPDSNGMVGAEPPAGAVVSDNEFAEPAYR
ncbi:MAG: hypothetical protein IH940_04835, partial [Acidobacteria bacterium]|nr:hypothetical protein [Acidobacteriota bacterium]